jgi:phage shock protein A
LFIDKETGMLKTFVTIFRGQAARAAEELADANAFVILDQHIRDAAAGLERARRALAIAMAQDAAEVRRIGEIDVRIVDLERRAIAALDGGREDLATEAAEAIAALEADKTSAANAHDSFSRESRKLRNLVANAERRLAELERGRRAARVSEAMRRLRDRGVAEVGGQASALNDAEAMLKRLREKQAEAEAADAALETLGGVSGADLIAEKLEAAGFGDQSRTTAASVLERLKQRRAAQQTASA